MLGENFIPDWEVIALIVGVTVILLAVVIVGFIYFKRFSRRDSEQRAKFKG